MKIGDREYPMRLTLGAMLRFRRETGKELNEIEVCMSMTMLTVLMWCCLVSVCQADGVECDLTIEQTRLLPAAAMEPQADSPYGRASPAVGQEGGCTEADRRAEHAQPVRGDAAEGRDVTEGVSAEVTDAVLAEGHAGLLGCTAHLSAALAALPDFPFGKSALSWTDYTPHENYRKPAESRYSDSNNQ